MFSTVRTGLSSQSGGGDACNQAAQAGRAVAQADIRLHIHPAGLTLHIKTPTVLTGRVPRGLLQRPAEAMEAWTAAGNGINARSRLLARPV